MRDINFFSPYKGKNNGKKNELRYIYGLAGIIGLLIIITLGVNTTRIILLNKSIKEYNEKLNVPEVQSKFEEAEKINSKIDILNQYNSALSDVTTVINSRDNASDTVLNDISSTLPSAVSFKNLDINNDILTIQGVSSNREAVGELQYNLKSLLNVREVFVNSVDVDNSVEGEYSFDIRCVLRGVD